MIDTPSVDWLALSPSLALLAGAAIALLSIVLPPWIQKAVAATAVFAGFAAAVAFAVVLFDRSPSP